MDLRKKSILHLTVENYIDTAEPVGSVGLQKKHFSDVSSATIRHQLNELEKEGYLSQPHISSGRIPTDKGYRFYVDQVPSSVSDVQPQLGHIQDDLVIASSIGQDFYLHLLELMVPFVSGVTFLLKPDSFEEVIKGVHFLALDQSQILLILWDTKGNKKETLFATTQRFSQDILNQMSSYTSSWFSGKDITKLSVDSVFGLSEFLPDHFIDVLWQEILVVKNQGSTTKTLLIVGLPHLLKHPEFSLAQQANPVLEILDQRQILSDLLINYTQEEFQDVRIGQENRHENLKACSMVVKRFVDHTNSLGLVGMIGPRRMPYRFIIPFMSGISALIESCLAWQTIKKEKLK